MSEKKERLPYCENPNTQPIFGQPEDCWDMVNKYGTYEIQPTNESENDYPSIAQGLPRDWKKIYDQKPSRKGQVDSKSQRTQQ